MKLMLMKRILAIVLAMASVLNITPFSPSSVSRWLVGPGYTDALPAEKAEMLLDMYINQEFIYLSDDAEKTTRSILSEILIEVISSEGNGANIVATLDSLPVYDRNDRDTQRDEYTPDTPENQRIKQSLRKIIEESALPDEFKAGFGYFADGVNDVRIYLIPTNYEHVFELAGDCVSDAGVVNEGNSGVYYDKSTKMVYGLYDNGILQIGFDFRADDITMSNPVHAWQRKFGYNILYDIVGNAVMIDTDTVRVKFDYDGKHKMFQFWKGNYTKISNGCEIGLYNRRDDSIWLYDSVSDDELMYMSLQLWHGNEMILKNDYQKHWWLTGYQPGDLIEPSELRLDCTIEFPNQEMFDAFIAAAKDAFGRRATILEHGLTAHIIWQ